MEHELRKVGTRRFPAGLAAAVGLIGWNESVLLSKNGPSRWFPGLFNHRKRNANRRHGKDKAVAPRGRERQRGRAAPELAGFRPSSGCRRRWRAMRFARPLKASRSSAFDPERRSTQDVFAAADQLTAVGCFSVGTNQVDLECRRRKRGIPVFNAPFSNTRSVAELVIGEIVMLLRRIFPRSVGGP